MYSQAAPCGENDQGQPHQTRVGQVHLVLGQLHRRRRHADDDHQRHEQLRHRHAEVACALAPT